jgi:L-serine/L-threonine ammonia-lyase
MPVKLHTETPLVFSSTLTATATENGETPVLLKLDNLQPSGSFKIRGIGNLAQRAFERGKKRLISSSGGNAGMAVAYAGSQLDMEVKVVVPSSTPEFARKKIKAMGAHVIVHGSVWDEADKYARGLCDKDSEAQYCHPFEHVDTWEGHSSLVGEIDAQCRAQGYDRPACVVLSVGGGGLLCGVAQGLHAKKWADVPIVTVETDGAHSFYASHEAQKLVTLDGITSVAKSLGALTVSEQCLTWSKKHDIHPLVISDRQCVNAMNSFANDHRMLVEPACAAALTAAYEGLIPSEVFGEGRRTRRRGKRPIVVIVCGGNIVDLKAIDAYNRMVDQKQIPDSAALLKKRGMIERFYGSYVDPFIDQVAFNCPPGPPLVPACYVINAFKAGTLPMCLYLMHHFQNYSKSAVLIAALHGSYGGCWFLKHYVIPDHYFMQKITFVSALMMGMVLSFYWASAYLVISAPSKGDFIGPVRMFVAMMMYIFGVVLMMASDTQKYYVLKLVREKRLGKILISDGWFKTCRNTNYLGEILLYSSFAVCAQSWIPWAFNGVFWSIMFVARWMGKEASFRRKVGGEEYMANSSLILPFPLFGMCTSRKEMGVSRAKKEA